jgi:hypothetical protein
MTGLADTQRSAAGKHFVLGVAGRRFVLQHRPRLKFGTRRKNPYALVAAVAAIAANRCK